MHTWLKLDCLVSDPVREYFLIWSPVNLILIDIGDGKIFIKIISRFSSRGSSKTDESFIGFVAFSFPGVHSSHEWKVKVTTGLYKVWHSVFVRVSRTTPLRVIWVFLSLWLLPRRCASGSSLLYVLGGWRRTTMSSDWHVSRRPYPLVGSPFYLRTVSIGPL